MPIDRPSRPAPLIGRDTERALLDEVLARLRSGRGRAVLIEGEAGIGKSALLDAALARVDTAKCQVIQGRCDELTRQFPLGVLTGAPGLGEFSGRARSGQVASALPRPDGTNRPGTGIMLGDPVLVAIEELLELVHRMTVDRPLVLVLEDMHWADEASLLFWRRLCRVTPQLPLVLVGTRRPLPRPQTGLLEREVTEFSGVVMPLNGLSPENVTVMTADLVDGVPGPRLLRWLERGAGNPFYIRELVDAAARAGALQVAGGTTELSGQAEEPGGLAGQAVSLQQAVASRLDFLSDDALQALRMAALLGPEFSMTELAAVTGRSPTALLHDTEDAIAAGLLEPAGSRLRFRHALLQQALYEGMPAPMRAGLHRQAAQSLIDARRSAELIARQLLAVPDLGDGWEVDWLTANATALANRVPAVASDLLERALRRVSPSDARRAGLEDHLADALLVLGRYQQVEDISRAMMATNTDPDRYGRLMWLLAYALLRTQRYEDAVAELGSAAGRADVSRVWRARFGALRAMVQRYTGPRVEAIEAAESAVAEGRELDDATAVAYGLHAQSIQHFETGDLTTALDLIDQALPLTSSDPQLADLRLLLSVNQASLTEDLGHYDKAWALAEQTLARSELSGSPRLGTLRVNVGLLAYEVGRWDEAMAELESVTNPARGQAELYSLQALIAGHRDDWPEALRHLATLKSMTDAYPLELVAAERDHHGIVVLAAAALEREAAGETQQAVSLLADCLSPGREHQLLRRYEVLPALVRLALAAGDETMARAATAAARSNTDRGPLIRKRAAVQWCEGLVNSDPATVQAAARSLRDLGLVLDTGNALEDAAVLLAQAGDTAASRTALDDALQVYARLGATWDRHRATARVRPFGVRPGVRGLRRRPETGWGALTTMERQVAELVAAGRSNPDIAGQLFISRRTAESHVSRILAKLQITSRWEVRAAAEQAQAHRARPEQTTEPG